MFLKKVYQQWRAFFWAIIIALAAQFFFMAKGIENVPFFIYSMYSYAHQPQDSFNVILVKTQGGYLNPYQLSGRESEMLMNNISYFSKMKKLAYQDYITPTVERRFKNKLPINTYNFVERGLVNNHLQFSKYTGWWKRYLATVYKNPFDSVMVVSAYIQYQPEFSKSPVDSVIFTCYFK
ncbi:MAG: hypothetical protein H7Z13_08110 [Ferruginibacter sp.]|nr:hypothetical protein [Ferruginibacter sp.]